MVNNYPPEGDDTVERHDMEKLSILFWNRFWNLPFVKWGGNTGFVNNGRKYTNCYTTNLRKKMLEKIIELMQWLSMHRIMTLFYLQIQM